MKQFRINTYITLKLEKNKTNIYINGNRYLQCKYLLIVNPQRNSMQWEINSIDEASYRLRTNLENNENVVKYNIDPSQEFWGHCSNLQAWSENNYDTRLIHSNLAFPLLRKLQKVGDKVAQKVFKEEIVKRLSEKNVLDYLIEENYISFLNQEEIFTGLLIPEEVNMLIDVSNKTKAKYILRHPLLNKKNKCSFISKSRHVTGLEINLTNYCDTIPKEISKLEKLTHLKINVANTKMINFGKTLNNLLKLKIIIEGKTFIPNEFLTFPKLEILEIYGKVKKDVWKIYFEETPNTIGLLTNLKKLYISNVKLEKVPDSFNNLNKLEILYLKNTNLKILPDSIMNKKSLKFVDISENKRIKPEKISQKIKKK